MYKALSTGRRSPRMRSGAIWAVAATTFVAVLAGCSSSGGSKSQSGSTSPGGTSAGTAGDKANVAEAKAVVAKWEAPPSFNLNPLKSAPPRGKRIALVYNNVSTDILNGAEEAAQALGWTAIPIQYDTASATGLVDAFAKAVQENPDGVMTTGANATEYAQAAKQFAAKNIPVVTNSSDDAMPFKPPVIANTNDPAQVELSGRITAAYVVAKKGADANVALYNIPSISVLKVYENAFKAEYLRLCPSCKYKSIAVQAGDIGTKVPAQVVSTIQTDPKINFLVMGFGAVATGVPGALRTAGISGIKIVGEAPVLPNIENLTNGSEDMYVAFPLHGLGWKGIDALARYFNKESADIDTTAPQAFQILTKANTAGPAALPEVDKYQAYFKDLWQVG